MTTKLTDPGGSTVSVDDDKVDRLLAAGYTRQTAKSTSSAKSGSSSSKSSSK